MAIRAGIEKLAVSCSPCILAHIWWRGGSSASRESPPPHLLRVSAAPRNPNLTSGRNAQSLLATSMATAPRPPQIPDTPPSKHNNKPHDRSSQWSTNPNRSFSSIRKKRGKTGSRNSNLGEEDNGAEEGVAQVRVPSARVPSSNDGVVLDDPIGEIDGDALVAEEIDALIARIGLQKVPEASTDTHLPR